MFQSFQCYKLVPDKHLCIHVLLHSLDYFLKIPRRKKFEIRCQQFSRKIEANNANNASTRQCRREFISLPPNNFEYYLFFPAKSLLIWLVKNNTLSFYFELHSFLAKLSIFMEVHACSKLPLEVFILSQLCSITRRNSYWNQPLLPPLENLFGFIKTYFNTGFYIPLYKNEWLHTWVYSRS